MSRAESATIRFLSNDEAADLAREILASAQWQETQERRAVNRLRRRLHLKSVYKLPNGRKVRV